MLHRPGITSIKLFIIMGQHNRREQLAITTQASVNLLTSTTSRHKEAAIYEDDSTPSLEEFGTTFTHAPFLHFLHRLSQVHTKQGFKSGFG